MKNSISRRDFLKLAGAASAGLALSACGVKATEIPTATLVVPTKTAVPTTILAPTTTPNFENLNKVIHEQIGKIVRAYQLSENQKEILANSVETVEVEGKNFWFIASRLLDTQDKNLAELIGDVPVAIQLDFETWSDPGFKEVTNLPIGAEFQEWEEDSLATRPSRKHWDFGIISSEWGITAFGVGATGEKRSIFDFITIKDDDTVILDTSQCTWEHYEDYHIREAEKYFKDDAKGIDRAGKNRRFILLPVVYPGSEPKDFEKLTKNQAISLLKQYVSAVINRYKEHCFGYMGVTEFGMSNDGLLQKIGSEYIDIIYQQIREADPTAVLILEHTDNHVPDTDMTKLTRMTAQRLKDKGLIDVIASECHIDLFTGSPHNETYDEIFETFKSYPVPTFPSSIDVNVAAYKNQPDKFITQAKKTQTVLQASIDAGAPYIGFWGGFPDERSWIELVLGIPEADATPWATGWIEKPFYFEILRILFRNYAKIGASS